MQKTRAKRGLSHKVTVKDLCGQNTRSKKIQAKFYRRTDYRVVKLPVLELGGRWLENAGFAIGQKVVIVISDRCITISTL